jgi:hypothetical protein
VTAACETGWGGVGDDESSKRGRKRCRDAPSWVKRRDMTFLSCSQIHSQQSQVSFLLLQHSPLGCRRQQLGAAARLLCPCTLQMTRAAAEAGKHQQFLLPIFRCICGRCALAASTAAAQNYEAGSSVAMTPRSGLFRGPGGLWLLLVWSSSVHF